MVDMVKTTTVPRPMPGLSSPHTELAVVPHPSAPAARQTVAGLALRAPQTQARNLGGAPAARRFGALPRQMPTTMPHALVVGGADMPVVAHPEDREQALTVRQAIGDRHDAARIEKRLQGPIVAQPQIEVQEPPEQQTHPLLLMGTSPMRQLVSGGIQRRPQVEVQEPPEAAQQQRLLMPAPHAEITVGDDGVKTLDISGPPAKSLLQPPAEKALIAGAEAKTHHQQVAVRTKVQQQAKKLAEQVLLQRSLTSELKVKNALIEQIAQQGYVVVNNLVTDYSNGDSSESDTSTDSSVRHRRNSTGRYAQLTSSDSSSSSSSSGSSTELDEVMDELSDSEIADELDISGGLNDAGVAAGAPDEPDDSDDDSSVGGSSAGDHDVDLNDVPEQDDAMADEELDISGGDAGVGGAGDPGDDDPDDDSSLDGASGTSSSAGYDADGDDDSTTVGDSEGVSEADSGDIPDDIDANLDAVKDAGGDSKVIDELKQLVKQMMAELKEIKEDSAKKIEELSKKNDELLKRLEKGGGGAMGKVGDAVDSATAEIEAMQEMARDAALKAALSKLAMAIGDMRIKAIEACGDSLKRSI
jgi:hypothetical protein